MSTISASTTSTTAYKVTADTTGTLVLQTGATPTTAVTVGTDQSVTFAQAANLPNTFGFKNRIINGAMVIDQRNAGASKTLTASTITYTVDRFGLYCTTGTGHTYQQVTDAPAGFLNSFKFTVGTGGTPSSLQQNVGPYQIIEGYNTTDFNWGAASAIAVTLSFWVKSSLTGTFCVSIQSNNSSGTYSYVATYSVASANTWQYTTITIPANTYNVPFTTTSGGVSVFFGLGSGSTFTTAANTWASGDFKFATGATNILGTNGATFYITGVQLEKGSTATSFDYRPYGTELALCQRYFQSNSVYGGGAWSGSTTIYIAYSFPVNMRTAPATIAWISGGYGDTGAGAYLISALGGTQFASVNGLNLFYTTAASGSAAGRGGAVYNALTTFSSEL